MGKFRSGMCLQAYRFVNCECKFFFFEVVKMESALGEPPKNKYIGNKHDSKFLFPPQVGGKTSFNLIFDFSCIFVVIYGNDMQKNAPSKFSYEGAFIA